MENEIPAGFWMVLISGLSIFVALILYYLAMLLKATTETMYEVRNVVSNSNRAVEEAVGVVADAKEIVTSVKNGVKSITEPITRVGTVINNLVSTVEALVGSKK